MLIELQPYKIWSQREKVAAMGIIAWRRNGVFINAKRQETIINRQHLQQVSGQCHSSKRREKAAAPLGLTTCSAVEAWLLAAWMRKPPGSSVLVNFQTASDNN